MTEAMIEKNKGLTCASPRAGVYDFYYSVDSSGRNALAIAVSQGHLEVEQHHCCHRRAVNRPV